MSPRYPALDVFRGFTIVLMIFVNSLNPHANLPWFQHSSWNGCTYADLVFPFFLLALGISLVLKRQHSPFALIQRSVLFIILGLGLNALWQLHPLRIPGVLQRIGLCYLFAGFIYIRTQEKTQNTIFILLLSTYWLFNILFLTTESGHLHPKWSQNALGWIDQKVFSSAHLLHPYFDPEGLMSSLGALATTILGLSVGKTFVHHPDKLWSQGLICLILAWIWQWGYPLNKAIWTGSYVLWTGGLGIILLAFCESLVKQQFWLTPLELMGRHSLWLFVIHILGLKILYFYHLWPWRSEGSHLNLSSLVVSCSYTLMCYVLCHSKFNHSLT